MDECYVVEAYLINGGSFSPSSSFIFREEKYGWMNAKW
jgi:hypothetical protein